ncbi:MAG TPA: hypothetical protein VGO29_08900 [Solirubrobacteraceae bacterium]|nr:hypothetical protein [Solirubrobacteraceae bacterium]
MEAVERPASKAQRLGALVWMAVEPLVAIALLLVVTGVMLHVTHGFANGRVVAAIVVPLALAGTCVLLNVCFERRARAQEYVLTELVLRFNGDLVHALPLRPKSARERIEARTPLLTEFAQDLLRIGREAPCAASRVMSAWVAVVLAIEPCGRWMWHAILQEGPGALLAGAAIAPGLGVFAIAFNDLRLGHIRGLRHRQQPRAWAHGYEPAREPTILPTVPVMVLCVIPAAIVGAMWSDSGSLETHLSVTQAVLALWLFLWNGRKAASSKTFVRVEHAFAPVDRLIRGNVVRTWDLLSRASRICGWSAAGMLALSFSCPTSAGRGVRGMLIGISSTLLTASLLLGLLVLNPWQRPVSPVTYSARHVLSRQSHAQEQRISTFLNVAFGCSLLVFVVIVGAG